MVKNLPAMQETWIPCLGYPRQYSCLENSTESGAWWTTIHGVRKSQTQLTTNTFPFFTFSLPGTLPVSEALVEFTRVLRGERWTPNRLIQVWKKKKKELKGAWVAYAEAQKGTETMGTRAARSRTQSASCPRSWLWPFCPTTLWTRHSAAAITVIAWKPGCSPLTLCFTNSSVQAPGRWICLAQRGSLPVPWLPSCWVSHTGHLNSLPQNSTTSKVPNATGHVLLSVCLSILLASSAFGVSVATFILMLGLSYSVITMNRLPIFCPFFIREAESTFQTWIRDEKAVPCCG